MTITNAITFLEAAATGSGDTMSTIISWAFPVLLIAVFYFLIIRPQRKKDKEAKDMLAALKPGDRVKTIGGFYGTVLELTPETVTMQCGPDKVRLVLARGAIGSVESVPASEEAPAEQIEGSTEK